MLFTVLVLIELHLSLSEEYLLITSSKTSSSMVEEFSKTLKIRESLNISRETDLTSDLSPFESKILIDLSRSPEFFPVLDELSEVHSTFYLTLTQEVHQSFSSFRYYLRMSVENEVKGLSKLINFLQWNQFNIFSTSSQLDLEISEQVKTEFLTEVKLVLTLVENISDFSVDSIVKKSIKAAGIRKILNVGGNEKIRRLQDFIKKRKLEIPGSHFLFSAEGIYAANLNGSIILTYPGAEEATSEEDFAVKLVQNTLNRFSSLDLRSSLESVCSGHTCNEHFTIVNIQKGVRVKVGTLLNNVNLSIPLVFPGGTSELVMNSTSTMISVSIANGTSEPNSTIKDYSYARVYKGAEYGVYRSNLNNEIPNFHLNLVSTDCGNSDPDESWYLKCFSSLKGKLGVTYLTSLSSGSAYLNYKSLKKIQYEIPQLSPMSSLEFLNNKNEFPYLLRLGISNFDFGENFKLFFLSFNWKSIIFFGSESGPYYSQYLEYLQIIQSINITVINPNHTRLFPSNYSTNDFEKYKKYFLFAKESKCRIFLLSSPYSADILEGLYDVGLRKEDVVVLSGISIYYNMFELVSEERMKKRNEFLQGIIVFTYREWVGELGEQLYLEISSLVPYSPTYLCVTYDTISVLKVSINHLLALGEDYEDPAVLMSSLRMQRLTGCMGNLYFFQENNMVATFKLGLAKMIYNYTINQYLLSYFATSSKYDTTIIQYSKTLEWPDGSTKTPSNFIEFGKCGFDQRRVKSSQAGKTVAAGVALTCIVVTLVSAVISAKFFSIELQPIREGQVPYFADHLVKVYMIFSSFQIAALGNDDGIFESIGFRFHKLIGINLISYFNPNQEEYWSFFRVLLFLTVFYNISAVFYLLMQKPFAERLKCLSKLCDFFYYFLPIFGHILLIPVVSVLMTVFSCSKSTGTHLTDSYLDFDCLTSCYSKSHLLYSIFSMINLITYITISVIFRPYWEIHQVSLNIRTKVSYTSVLSIFQIAVVMLSSVLKMVSEHYSGFAVALLLFALAVVTIKSQPYNYQRGVAIHLVVLLVNFWFVLLDSVFSLFRRQLIAWLMIIGGLVLSMVGGYVVSKIPEELVSPISVDIHELIRLLCSRALVYEINARNDSNSVITSQAVDNRENDQTTVNLSLFQIDGPLGKIRTKSSLV